MFHMRNLKLMMPRSSEYRLVFPLLMYTFRYDRSSFNITKVGEKCAENEFHSVMDDIERASEYFKKFLVVKLISLFSLVSLGLLLVIGIGIIAYDAITNKNRTRDEFTNLTKDPQGHLMDDRSNSLSDVTVIGIFLIILGIFQFIIIIIVLNISTKRAISDYTRKINLILIKRNENFIERGIKWNLGEGCLWVELRLDFKYNILAINSEQIIKNKFGASQQVISQKDHLSTPPRSVRIFDFNNDKQSLNDSFDFGKESKGNKLKHRDEEGGPLGSKNLNIDYHGHILLDTNNKI